MKIADVMTKQVRTVESETPLKEVARILAYLGISGLPVASPEGRVLGIVSEGDLLFKERGTTPADGACDPRELQRTHLAGEIRVGDCPGFARATREREHGERDASTRRRSRRTESCDKDTARPTSERGRSRGSQGTAARRGCRGSHSHL